MTQLTKTDQHGKGQRLARYDLKFIIAFADKLDKGYEVKDLSERGCKEFQSFLSDTVYKGLTISQVESLYRRRDDNNLNDEEDGKAIIHFGKDRKPFRIFGYYNSDGYFIITRLDQNHKTHKE